jgi:hypothetical protein
MRNRKQETGNSKPVIRGICAAFAGFEFPVSDLLFLIGSTPARLA